MHPQYSTAIQLLQSIGYIHLQKFAALDQGRFALKSFRVLKHEIFSTLYQYDFVPLYLEYIKMAETILRILSLLEKKWTDLPTSDEPLSWSFQTKEGTLLPLAKLNKHDIRLIVFTPNIPILNYQRIGYILGFQHDQHTWIHFKRVSKFLLPMESDLIWRILHNGLNVGYKFQYLYFWMPQIRNRLSSFLAMPLL